MATNDYLSAAEIADIRARWECLAVAIEIDRSLTPDEEVAAEDDLRKLLADLGAITGPTDRESGGRLVREVWIAWAKEQPNPKPSWLVEWDGLSEPDREVDRRIFEACAASGHASGLAKGEELRHQATAQTDNYAIERDEAKATIDRLTAELAEVRKEATAVRDDVVHSMTREADARVAAARADGARVERGVTVAALEAEIGGCVTPDSEYERALRLAIGIVQAGNAEADAARDREDNRRAVARIAWAREDAARDERVKSAALIATLRELLEEREWDFEDNGRESNSCRTCGVTVRHGDPMKHKPGCALDAALRGAK